MRYQIIIVFLTLNSCALLSKYEYGQHRYFNSSLTPAEKNEININGTLIKHWIGTNNLGDSLIGDILINNSSPYEFIEIGEWRETSQLRKNNKRIGTYSRNSIFDLKGNLISMSSYFQYIDSDIYILTENMESIATKQNGQKILKQIYKGYYDTGELRYQFSLRTSDYEVAKSDKTRKKDLAESIKYYDKNGEQLSSIPTNPYNGISKFTKMK